MKAKKVVCFIFRKKFVDFEMSIRQKSYGRCTVFTPIWQLFIMLFKDKLEGSSLSLYVTRIGNHSTVCFLDKSGVFRYFFESVNFIDEGLIELNFKKLFSKKAK